MGPSDGCPGDEDKAPSMRRELSVEDLFAPLNRLDVRHPSSAADASPNSRVMVRVSGPQSAQEQKHYPPYADPSIAATHPARADREQITASTARSASGFAVDMAPIPEEAGLGSGFAGIKERSRLKGSSRSKSPASGSDTGLQTQGNSTSDEDQLVLDDRKQRRMLSNRESARRSRLRKQQLLDELRAHVAQLRAQNSQMLSSFNLASQHFSQITEENRQLRSEAMDLSHQLQRLHHTVVSQHSTNGLRYGTDSGQVVQGTQY